MSGRIEVYWCRKKADDCCDCVLVQLVLSASGISEHIRSQFQLSTVPAWILQNSLALSAMLMQHKESRLNPSCSKFLTHFWLIVSGTGCALSTDCQCRGQSPGSRHRPYRSQRPLSLGFTFHTFTFHFALCLAFNFAFGPLCASRKLQMIAKTIFFFPKNKELKSATSNQIFQRKQENGHNYRSVGGSILKESKTSMQH